MNNSTRKFANPKKPVGNDWHPADIIAAIHKTGWSLRQLSFHHGWSGSLVRAALAAQYPRAERIIADAIGVEPWEIWPSRYDAQQQPLRAFRPPLKPDSTTARKPRRGSRASAA